MKIVVIGATGQLGQEFMRLFGDAASGVSHAELDVTDGVAVALMLRAMRPDWVITTAAFHRVDECEGNPTRALAVNGVGALNVAAAAATLDAGVVFFSTDHVFGGERRSRTTPYDETSPPHPVNTYGISKLAGEQFTTQGNPRALVIRTAGLYGLTTSRKGWTFPELMLHKARVDDVVRVVTDQVVSPTYTLDLAHCVRSLMEQGASGLFHLTNAGECSWYDLAHEVFRVTGVRTPLEPIEGLLPGQRAQRPRYSAMTSVRLGETGVLPLRPWHEAVQTYLREKGLC